MTTRTATELREGRITELGDDGSVWVDGIAARVLSSVTLADLRVAQRDNLPVLLRGDPPVVLGVVQGRVAVPDGRLVLEAARELVLRCGAGEIRISADGTVRLAGRDIRSAARRMQRLTGAQVKIN